jgi:hypothetical protein
MLARTALPVSASIYEPLVTYLTASADWVQYYADMAVGGIHMYAAVADYILSPQGGGYMHMPGSYRALSIDSHRLIQWKVFHPSPWSLHYYGQVWTHCCAQLRAAGHSS